MRAPSISVVVNTCDRADPLRTLLYALNRQSYQNFEVIVVVGPTRDHSVEVVSEFGRRVTLLRCPQFNLSMSRNMGIGAAAGEIVAFIDDDAVPALTWLEQLADAFTNPDITGAGGQVFMVHPGHGYLQFKYGLFSVLGEDVDVRLSPAEPLPFTTPPQYWYPRLMGTNMAYRRAALLDVGGYDERFAYLFEEPDLAIRMGLKGYQIQPLAEATVYHAPASSRNRQNFSWNINWYAWMRGIIYFTLKNGGPVAGRSVALRRAIRHTHTFFTNIREYRNNGALPADLYPGIRRQLRRGARWGFGVGLFGRRHIGHSLQPVQRAFQPFPAPASTRYPNIGPLPALTTQKVKPMSELPLRVCLLSSHYPPQDTGGVARLTHMLAQGLAGLGHEVHVIKAGPVDRVTYYDGAYVHQIRGHKRRYKSYNRPGYYSLAWNLNYSHAIHTKVEALRREHNIQLVDSPLWLLEGLVTAVSGEVPVVTRLVTSMRQLIELNGGVPDSPEMALIADLEKEFLTRSNGLVPVSDAIKQTCAQIYPFDFSRQPHRVIHAGIIPLPETSLQLPVDRPKADPLVLFVGRLEKRKGVLDLFEAIPLVLQEFPQATFWLAGGDNSDNDGFARLHRLTYPQYFQKKYPALADRVRFLGYVPDNKLDDLYRVCDLFVAPSLYESFGLIFLEAMNHARPVVGCRVGGPAEIVAHGETGLLVPPESPAELAAAIIKLLAQPLTRREMGLAGRQRLLQSFTYQQMAAQYVQFYRAVLG
ncbi:MAG: hypothetical protein Kow0031_08110 [Anaerolineae bacterium]